MRLMIKIDLTRFVTDRCWFGFYWQRRPGSAFGSPDRMVLYYRWDWGTGSHIPWHRCRRLNLK